MIVAHCGPPAAGKSTVAAAAGERLEERGHGFRTIHSDEFSGRTYEQLYERVTESDAAPDGWLLDGAFYRQSFRGPFEQLGARFVHATADRSTCQERNRQRDAPTDEVGVRVVHHEFDPLDADLTLDTDELSVQTASERLVGGQCNWRRSTVSTPRFSLLRSTNRSKFSRSYRSAACGSRRRPAFVATTGSSSRSASTSSRTCGRCIYSGATTIRSRASRAERGGRQNTPRKRWQRSERICNRLG